MTPVANARAFCFAKLGGYRGLTKLCVRACVLHIHMQNNLLRLTGGFA